VLGKPNWKQNRVRNNTYTLSWDAGTFNIRYDVVRLVLVQRAGLGVGDIGNTNVISENRTRGSRFVLRKSRRDRSRSCFNIVTCFAIQENK